MQTIPKKSQMETLYEEWLARDDRIIEKDERTFYRIISKNKLSLNGGTVIIVVPLALFKNKSWEFIDENGHSFCLGSPNHISFKGSIPMWYLETASVIVKGIHKPAQIGDYLAEKDIRKPTTSDNVKRMRNGEKIKCPRCENGYITAVGDPKTTNVFRCDSCETGMVLTISHSKLK